MRYLAFIFCFLSVCAGAQETSINPTQVNPAATLKDPKEILDLQISTLDDLITMTDQTLKSLRNLQKQILIYKDLQEAYIQDPEDKDLLFRMSKSANDIFEKIKTDQLTQTFDPEFISELKMLTQIYKKIGLPKP